MNTLLNPSNRLNRIAGAAALVGALLFTVPLSGAPVTNQDIIKLLGAGLGEDVILNVIASGEPQFDTSADGLVALKTAGASDKVISAVTMASAAKSSGAAPVGASAANPFASTATMSADFESIGSATLIDGDKSTQMKYVIADTKAKGWGPVGAGSYHVLKGAAAKVRTRNAQPKFLVYISKDQQPEDQFLLARWEPRKNGTREILSGKATMFSVGGGFPKERIVAVTFEKAPDQSKTLMGWEAYLITPTAPLAPGEYCLMKNGGIQVYDFGIDPAQS